MKGFVLCVAILCLAIPSISPIHSGGTDGDGGHYNHSTGEYHYHHGYSAHQHYNGKCPYDVQEEEYDCGREDCDIPGQHYHANKATTTTTKRTTEKQQNSKNDSVSKDSSDNNKGFMESLPWPIQLLFGVSIAFFPLTISIIYGGFVRIKDFIYKRRKKGKH